VSRADETAVTFTLAILTLRTLATTVATAIPARADAPPWFGRTAGVEEGRSKQDPPVDAIVARGAEADWWHGPLTGVDDVRWQAAS
jgi:hypothetical protein